MAKFVIFKQGDDYKFTTEENYASRISNARRIATFKPDNGFKDAKIVLDYILRTSPDLKAEDIRVLTESADSEIDESRYNGIVDQIDVLLGMQADSGHLSDEQRKQLAELRDRVYAYGERGAKWAKECDIALGNERKANWAHECNSNIDSIGHKFDNVIGQIDNLLGTKSDNSPLSVEAMKQLAEIRDQLADLGDRAGKVGSKAASVIAGDTPRLESMMDFYARFVSSFDCPQVLAEASMNMFKEVLLEASQSGDVAERLRQKVGVNPNETQGVGVFGISGDDNLPQQTTIDNEISDAMVSGTFDTLGDNISTADPNNFDETSMGLGSSELDTSGNDLNPDDWASTEEPFADEGTEETEGSDGTDVTDGTGDATEPGAEQEPDAAEDEDNLETLDL
jgi:hypothetical protein